MHKVILISDKFFLKYEGGGGKGSEGGGVKLTPPEKLPSKSPALLGLTLLSTIDVIRELPLIWFPINLLVSFWIKSPNGFSNFYNSPIASIVYISMHLWNSLQIVLSHVYLDASLSYPTYFSRCLNWWSFLYLTAIAVI